jgi:hypothetical protein
VAEGGWQERAGRAGRGGPARPAVHGSPARGARTLQLQLAEGDPGGCAAGATLQAGAQHADERLQGGGVEAAKKWSGSGDSTAAAQLGPEQRACLCSSWEPAAAALPAGCWLGAAGCVGSPGRQQQQRPSPAAARLAPTCRRAATASGDAGSGLQPQSVTWGPMPQLGATVARREGSQPERRCSASARCAAPVGSQGKACSRRLRQRGGRGRGWGFWRMEARQRVERSRGGGGWQCKWRAVQRPRPATGRAGRRHPLDDLLRVQDQQGQRGDGAAGGHQRVGAGGAGGGGQRGRGGDPLRAEPPGRKGRHERGDAARGRGGGGRWRAGGERGQRRGWRAAAGRHGRRACGARVAGQRLWLPGPLAAWRAGFGCGEWPGRRVSWSPGCRHVRRLRLSLRTALLEGRGPMTARRQCTREGGGEGAGALTAGAGLHVWQAGVAGGAEGVHELWRQAEGAQRRADRRQRRGASHGGEGGGEQVRLRGQGRRAACAVGGLACRVGGLAWQGRGG